MQQFSHKRKDTKKGLVARLKKIKKIFKKFLKKYLHYFEKYV